MGTIEEKRKYFDRQKFETENEGYIEYMEARLMENIDTAISEGRVRFDSLEKMYEECIKANRQVSADFQKEFKRHAHTLKGQSDTCYVKGLFEPCQKLETAIHKGKFDEIDSPIYEAFSFKKKYMECLHAIKGELFEEPEFDLRRFDDFTHLNLAPLYQALPVNAQSITFNNLANQQSLAQNNNDPNSSSSNRVLISEKITCNNQPYQIEENMEEKATDTRTFKVLRDIKSHSEEGNIYWYSTSTPREKGQSLYTVKRGANFTDDYPYEQPMTCQIF